jgi:hypothetical protein
MRRYRRMKSSSGVCIDLTPEAPSGYGTPDPTFEQSGASPASNGLAGCCVRDETAAVFTGGQVCRAKDLAASRLGHIASRQPAGQFCGTGIAPANLIGGFDVKDIQQKHARYTSGDLA